MAEQLREVVGEAEGLVEFGVHWMHRLDEARHQKLRQLQVDGRHVTPYVTGRDPQQFSIVWWDAERRMISESNPAPHPPSNAQVCEMFDEACRRLEDSMV